jgi:alpha-1,6-mannosyltransferase
MIVADITSFFSSSSGGIRTYYAEKARHLPDRGVECHFVVPGETADTSVFGGGWLHRVPGPPLAGSPYYRRFGDWSALVRTLADVDPDVIEIGSHYLLPEVVVPLAKRLGRRRRAVVGFYHADFPSTYVEPVMRRAPEAMRRMAVAGAWSLVRRQHRRYTATLVGSRHVADRLAEHGVPRVRWVGLGVDTETFRPRSGLRGDGPPVVAYVGRLSRDKEVGVLLDAVDGIHAMTGARVHIAGAGPLARAVAALAAARPWLAFHGHLASRGAVAALLREADAVVAPGRYESFSLATAEALASGVPAVVAGEGGAHELVVRSGGGIGFAPGDAAALVRATRALLVLPAAERAAMGARGRAHVVADHTWDRVFDRVHGIYQQVARETAGGRPVSGEGRA